MTEELRVKYLFVDLRYRNYVRLQVAIIAAWALLAVASYTVSFPEWATG